MSLPLRYAPFLLLLFFLSYSPLHGQQDTTMVQTLEWDSDIRAGFFTFPDDPNKRYEKILMYYNMRCHDLAIGNGNVGCREWDYSCNTFITDPNKIDSTQTTHPSHVISNFSGSSFDYTTQNTYTYYLFDQVEASYDSPPTTLDMPVVEGQTEVSFQPAIKSLKSHFLYTADELSQAGLSAGPLDGLQLDVSQMGSHVNFLRIALKATTDTELSPAQAQTSGFQEVYFRDTPFDQLGWKDFIFYQPFEWDGSSNLLVQITYNSPENGAGISVLGEPGNPNGSLITMQSDYSLDFSGSTTVDIDKSAFSSITDEITIALWTYGYPDLLPANTTIFDAVDPNNNRTLNVHLPWGNSQVYWDCGNDGGSYDRINKTASESELEGQWNHWAFTKNRSTGVMRIFLNGQLWHSGSGMTRPINIDIFKLGQNVGANRSYAGRIDDFQVWNKALEEETIREWMRRPMSEQHPNYDNLLIYYDMNEGAGQLLNNLPDPSYNSVLTGVADWKLFRGNELFKDFVPSPLRLNLQLLTEGENITFDYVSVIDSISNPASAVNYFAVEGTDMLLLTNTEYLWPATPSYLISEAGDTLTEYPIQAEGSIDIGELVYYNKRDAKYEILSLVTPYGNGLDLGQAGKTFWFDVTDYAPILKGEKYLSIEMGGQWQEELDIRFYFVEGTPPRDVINIQNIWPFARGWFADIQADNIFEPRQLDLLPEGAAYKIRSAVTGHGQNGEFQPREHYINVNEGNQEFPYDVWKTCGENPMFPQGGTWLFDRAGWCPGMATDIHEFDITNLVSSGGQVTLDYGLNGAFMSEANYLVSNQLVTYGAPNFDVDASLEDIVRPSNRDEYARINPACNSPIIRIKNTGANTLESLRISYGIVGQEMIDYEWTGALPFMAIEEVTLPTYDQSYWQGLEGEAQFVVRIEAPNGASDEYAPNNELTSTFSVPDILDVERLQLHLRTNNRANENSYQILDANGEVLISRANMEDATQYVDELDLPDGCFTLVLNDSGGDGLYYWYWQAIGQNVGSGSLSLKRFINDQIQVPVASFEPEFGNSVRYDFIIPGTVNTEDLAAPRLFSVYPNPVTDQFTLEMQGFASNTFQVQLIDLTGRVLWEQTHNSNYNGQLKENIDLNDWPAGIYSLKVQNGEENRIKTIVKQ